MLRAMEPVTSSPALAPPAKTLAEAFCARHGCTLAQFRARMFWRTLHWHAVPVAPFLRLGNFFAADEDLVAGCGRARSMHDLRDEIEEYRFHPLNHGWLRRRLGLRISTQRLRALARNYLPGANLPPPVKFVTRR